MSAGPPPLIVVMGVSGSGKTTVATPLAARLGWTFMEGDDLHPAANIAKMEAGEALTDADRAPWLAAVGAWIDEQADEGEPGVVTCSALKRTYREALTKGRDQVRIVWLEGSPAVIAARVARRRGHFMPPSLLDSQFATLEAPSPAENVLAVDIDQPVEAQVEAIVRGLGLQR
ncbi:MAG: gluconokinase [Caulobacteraceae bacterium]